MSSDGGSERGTTKPLTGAEEDCSEELRRTKGTPWRGKLYSFYTDRGEITKLRSSELEKRVGNARSFRPFPD